MTISVSIACDTSMPIDQASLPVTITLTPTATDTGDASPSMAFSYFIVSKPTGSSTVLSNSIGATSSLDIDTWGNYQIFVIATNSNSGGTSESNPVGAPLGSFFTVEVQSTNKNLQKPAPTQRNWQTPYHDLVDAVENLTGDTATLSVKGVSEIANIIEIATGAGKLDSDTGAEIVITPDRLGTVLGSDNAGGAITGGTVNNLRNQVKTIANERIAASSIDALADVDTTTTTPTNNDVLQWNGINFVPAAISANDGDITAVIAGTALSGGGTSGDVTLNVSGLTLTEFATGEIQLGGETFVDTDDQIMSAAAIKDLIDANAGGSSAGDARDIQLSDGIGGFIAANWQVTTGDDLTPNANGQYDIGATANRMRNVYAVDMNVSDDITLGDTLSIATGGEINIGTAGQSTISLTNGNADVGTMLLKTLGSDDAGTNSLIRNEADDVQFAASSTATEAKATLVGTSANVSLVTQAKMNTSHSIGVPSNASSAAIGDIAYVTDNSSGIAATDYATPTSRIAYSTHVSREVTEEASFSVGNMVFSGNEQACLYWVKNTTGQDVELRSTHIHVGEMRNLTLGFSLCKATSDANAISNTWTQVGSSFTLTNSSGVDNTVGQATATDTTNHTFANGDYIGIVCTSIPQSGRNDKRISITFDCRTQVEML